MYGNTEITAAGGALAATGMATGAYVLAAVGIILAGVALWMLIRKPGRNRP